MLRVTVLLVVAFAQTAHADSIRTQRPFSIGLSIPDELFITDHDITLPLPSLHLGYSITPAVSIELGAGGVPMEYGAYDLIGHVGVRYRLTDHALAPFVMTRVGVYADHPDEGDDGRYPFAVGGAGVEYVRDSGLGFWLDLGAGVANVDETALAIAGSLGIAFHL